jgi:protein ImuB
MFACLHGNGPLTALAFEFSPTVEQTAPHTVTLDASGLDRLFGLPQDVAAALARRAAESQVKAHIALAANPDAAICAARGFSGVSLIPYGDEAKFLAPLPLALLAPSPELRETLERWGIRRFQDLAALPPLGIAERLGPEGLRLRELARGEVERKLLPLEDPLRFEEEIELEYPVELLEPLAFVLARLVNGLATALATRALATNQLRLLLKLENRTTHERVLRLPAPTLDTKALLKLLQLDLDAHPPVAPVLHMRMEMNPVKPQSTQGGLFVPATPEPVKLELTLARLKAIVGPERVGSPELLDTWRPDAFRVGPALGRAPSGLPAGPNALAPLPAKRRAGTSAVAPRRATEEENRLNVFDTVCAPSLRLSLRLFRPPWAAHVALADGYPSFVAAGAIRGRILDLAGPWRTSGDWWTTDPWLRDEWDISLSDGALYRLFCDPRGWFVEGSYD